MRGPWLAGFLLVSIAITFAACGPSKPKVDDSRFITAISSDSNMVTIYLGNGNISNKPLVALFIRAGYISLVRNASGPPWVHYNVTDGTLQSDTFMVNAAHMVVDDRSDQREWKEEASEFFAETLKLHFEPEDKLKPFVPGKIGPIVIRLVLVNDPAVGQWQLSDKTQIQNNPSPGQLLSQSLETAGTALEPWLDNAIYSEIEAGEAENGIIERSASDPNVLVSRNNNLAYYVKPNAFAYTTVHALREYCASIRSPAFSDWHVPSIYELKAVFPQNSQPGTPRLWGMLLDGQPNFLTSTFAVGGTTIFNSGARDIGNRIFDTRLGGYTWAPSGATGANGYVDISAIQNGYVDPSVLDGLAYSSSRPSLKVICMAWVVSPVERACRTEQVSRYHLSIPQAQSGCQCLSARLRKSLGEGEFRTFNRWLDTNARSGLSGDVLQQAQIADANYERVNGQTLLPKAISATKAVSPICHVNADTSVDQDANATSAVPPPAPKPMSPAQQAQNSQQIKSAQPSFDCTKARAWAERQVCAVPSLASADRTVARLYGARMSAVRSAADKGQLRQTQRDWIRRRESCQSVSDTSSCLNRIYQSRIAELSR